MFALRIPFSHQEQVHKRHQVSGALCSEPLDWMGPLSCARPPVEKKAFTFINV